MQAPLPDPLPTGSARPELRLSPVLAVLIVLCAGVEMVLFAADHGWIGSLRWRALAYQNGAFWAGLLHNWRPNYDLQPVLMFFTYAFLHSGPGHLLGNMMMLFFLGNAVQERAGQGGLAALYAVSAVGGAAVFALLTRSPAPMVGASGALFGLAGAWQYWDWRERRAQGRRTWPVWAMMSGLVALNALLWLWQDGMLAWETHLGGFVAGWLGAMALRRFGRG